jgi:hypothetical protein
MMKNILNSKTDNKFDPIGIEIILLILTTSFHAISVFIQFQEASKQERIREKFLEIESQTLDLNRELTKFVGILSSLNQEGYELSNKKLTIEDTLLELRENQYYAYLEITKEINTINNIIQAELNTLRENEKTFLSNGIKSESSFDLANSFDNLMLSYSTLSFMDFIEKLQSFSNILHETYQRHNNLLGLR